MLTLPQEANVGHATAKKKVLKSFNLKLKQGKLEKLKPISIYSKLKMELYFPHFLVPVLLLNSYFLFLPFPGIEIVCLEFCGFFSFSWIFIFSVMCCSILSDCINHILSPEVNNILSSQVLFNAEESLHMWVHRYTFTIYCGAGTCIYQMLQRKRWEN